MDAADLKPRPIAVPFKFLKSVILVPVLINDSIISNFILDTGIGANIITKSLFDKIGCELTGQVLSGKRMSGQEVSSPLSIVPSITLGTFKQRNVTVGVYDLTLPPDFAEIGGFMSLHFFAENPFTIDYKSGNIVIEDKTSMLSRLERGSQASLKLEVEGPKIDAFIELDLPNGRTIEVEVDTGTDELVLHERLMEELGISSREGEAVKKVEGEDETGHRYVRYFARLSGRVSVAKNPNIAQQDPDVMFQDIIYQGLVGQSFLRHFTTTYDIPNSRLIFADSNG